MGSDDEETTCGFESRHRSGAVALTSQDEGQGNLVFIARDMAQFGSALASGARGRGFNSRYPDRSSNRDREGFVTHELEQVTTFAVAGDWHGNSRYAETIIAEVAGRVDLLLHVGDFGFDFTASFLRRVTDAANAAGVIVAFVDGNHEDFDWLQTQPVSEDGVRRLTDRVWHLPRGLRWSMMGVRFLALGGAHSVNRQDLRPHLDWWPQETISHGDVLRVGSGRTDVVISHDCPDGAPVPALGAGNPRWPEAELALAHDHRCLLREVVEVVQPRYLWHGHYHDRYTGMLALDSGGECRVTGLGCDTGPYGSNYAIVDVVDLLK